MISCETNTTQDEVNEPTPQEEISSDDQATPENTDGSLNDGSTDDVSNENVVPTENASTSENKETAEEEESAEEEEPVEEEEPEEEEPAEDEEPVCSPDFTFSIGVEIGSDLLAGSPSSYEPSGVVWHTRLQKLFLVDDGGYLTSMDPDGSNITHWDIGGDLEGVTIADPDSDFVYAVVEGTPKIYEIDIVQGVKVNTYNYSGVIPVYPKQGVEALTFIPIDGHENGGVFVMGNQGDGYLYFVNVPILTGDATSSSDLVDEFQPKEGTTDLSGLHYDAETETFYIIYDWHNLLITYKDGVIKNSYTLPGNDQEGFTISDDCSIFIAEDPASSHEVWVY